MRMKNFTLMLVAFLVSAATMAQKSFAERSAITLDRHVKVQKVSRPSDFKTGLDLNQIALPAANTTKAGLRRAEIVTPPSDGEVEYFTLTGKNSRGGETTRTVKVVWDGDDDVYISGLSYYLPDAFVKGTFADDENVVFAKGQYMGNAGADIYFGASSNGKDFVDAVATFDADENTFTFNYYLLDNKDPEAAGYYAYWQKGVTISPVDGDVDMPVEIPNGLEVTQYAYTAHDYFDDVDISGNLNIGFYGSDVYIQGLSDDVPTAWVKGTMDESNIVTFMSGQMLEKDLFFVAINNNFEVVDEYTLVYNPEDDTFEEGENACLINSYKDKIDASVYQFCYGYEIKPIVERNSVPAKSVISSISFEPASDVLNFALAKVDVDGYGLVVETLAYKLYYVTAEGDTLGVTFTKNDYPTLTEDLTEIPATFIDNTYFKNGALTLKMAGYDTWKRIGISAVNHSLGASNESEIAWYAPSWPISTTLPEGLTVTEHVFKGQTYSSGNTSPFERTVGLAIDGDDLYIRGIGEVDENAWVKGTKTDVDTYTFPKGQRIGVYNNRYCLFLVGYANNEASDITLKVDAADGVYTFPDVFLENASYTDRSYYFTRFVDGATINIAEEKPEVPTVVTVPDGLKTETYQFRAQDYFAEEGTDASVSRSVLVGFDGDDVYVQGVSEVLPQAWVKGVIDGDVVSFTTGQYLGTYRNNDLWFIGYDMNSRILKDYQMYIDTETGTMENDTEDDLIGINTYKNKVSASLYEFYFGTKISKISEAAVVPAAPSVKNMVFSPYGNYVEINVPAADVNGDGLVNSLLSYKFYYEDVDGQTGEVTFTTDRYEKLEKDMAEIPYGFYDSVDEEGNPSAYDFSPSFVYLNMEHNNWARIGMQSVYIGGGERNESEINWYTIKWPVTTELPEDATIASYTFSGTYNSSYSFSRIVRVATSGDDIYIQRLGRANDQIWVKATKGSDGNYTFASAQYMGLYGSQSSGYSYLFLLGNSDQIGLMDPVMKYDEETKTFTFMTQFIENADYTDKIYYLTRYEVGCTLTFYDYEDAISSVEAEAQQADGVRYNVAGQIVGKNYKGIVVKNGKKMLQK